MGEESNSSSETKKVDLKLTGGALPSGPCMLGVDEAGRGPVLGPMVYGIAFCPISEAAILKDLGCADSKTLTEEKREVIYEKMLNDENVIDKVGWMVDVISPNHISNCMLQRAKYSLNEISMNSAINLIKKAAESGVDITEVYVDTVGPPEKYRDKLLQIFPNYKITVAKKADSTYPIVSAASIVAKVTRDRALRDWHFKEGLKLTQKDFGSGYPSDPTTKKFIKSQFDQVFGYPDIVRFSWSTAELALNDLAFPCTWEDEEELEEKKKKTGSKRISSFFANVGENGSVKKKRHLFFTERQLELAENF